MVESGQEGAQVWIAWSDWGRAEYTAATVLLPALETGPVSGWWFLRKKPYWRLRHDGGPDTRAHLDHALGHLKEHGLVTGWHHSIYEPETAAFGGMASMGLAHRLFHHESRHLLHRAAHPEETDLGARELSVLGACVFLRAVGLDWYEQGDVWARVAALRSHPEPLPTVSELTKQVHSLLRADHRRLVETGPLHHHRAWVRELTKAGAELAELYRRGYLTRGLRAVCAHHLIFSFNRWGLPGRDQLILSTTARKAVMTNTTAQPTDATATAQEALIDTLCAGGHLRSTSVEEAFRAVPRHLFVPNATLEQAYADNVVSVKDDETGRSLSCASAPRIVAMMLEQAAVEPGMHILELGTGTGFNAALLAHLTGRNGSVVTVDVDQDLTDNAAVRLAQAGADNVEVVLGDGAEGHQPGAPYDLVIATVGSHQVPAAWLRQLAPSGRLVAPIRIVGDVSRSIVFERAGDQRWCSVDSQLSTFMPLRDSIGDDTRAYTYPSTDGSVTLQVNREQQITPPQVEGVLEEPAHTVWTGITLGGMEPRDGLWLHLALALPNSLSRMNANRSALDTGLVSPGLPWGDMASVPATGRGLAYLTARRAHQDNTWELGVIGHAEQGHALAHHMAQQIRSWDRTQQVHFTLRLTSKGTELTPTWE